MSKWLLFGLLFVSGNAFAACAGHLACVSWKASPGWTDGTTYAPGTVVTYTVYKAQSPSLLGSQIAATTTSLEVTLSGLAPGVWYFAVTATADGKVSSLSGIASKRIRNRAPTEGSIERPTDGAIEPR